MARPVHAGHVTFAATPPLEALRYLLSWSMTKRRRSGRWIRIVILVLDVSRAHFHPPAVRELYIDLPEEDFTPGFVGRLLRTLYGTRDAANQWDDYANSKIEALGFVVGMSSPCLYHHKDEECIGWRHGDDIIFAGEREFVLKVQADLEKDMILKRRAVLGWESGEDKHCDDPQSYGRLESDQRGRDHYVPT